MTLSQTLVAPAQSEWPMPLMLDEAWLRARRALVHALEADRMWPDPATQRSVMAAQRAEGERLRDSVLFETLGPADFAHRGSESIFGASNAVNPADSPSAWFDPTEGHPYHQRRPDDTFQRVPGVPWRRASAAEEPLLSVDTGPSSRGASGAVNRTTVRLVR